MIGELLRKLTRRKRAQERERSLELFCFLEGMPYPKLVQELPSYADEAEEIIRTHAKQGLPAVQFESRIDPSNIEDMVEIGGVLGYNGSLFEIVYKHPGPASATDDIWIPFDKTEKANELIHFHSHPNGDNKLGKGDLRNIKRMLNAFGGKKSYFLLYTPKDDKIVWYEFTHF